VEFPSRRRVLQGAAAGAGIVARPPRQRLPLDEHEEPPDLTGLNGSNRTCVFARLEGGPPVPPARPARNALLAGAGITGAALLAFLVIGLADATQTRAEEAHGSVATTVVFEVDVRGEETAESARPRRPRPVGDLPPLHRRRQPHHRHRPRRGAGRPPLKAELRQSRQNSLPSGSVITMKPALIGGAGS
jgi:hypothetical protein